LAESIEASSATDGSNDLDPEIIRQLSQSLKIGVMLVDIHTLAIEFENATMFKWFPPGIDESETIETRIPGFDTETALSRAERGRPYKFEVETSPEAKNIPVEFEVRKFEGDFENLLIVEGHDISKQKQSEYMLESYSEIAERNARELQNEKERAERLLLNIMPKSVYEEMKDFGTVTPQTFENATILMLDFVGSTEMAVAGDPVSLIGELNDMFLVFDRIADQFGCERIRTVGDAYIAVSGLPEPTPDHAKNVARLALRMIRYIERRNSAHATKWLCRIGINSGPVIGSLVGVQKYVYDIFGPGINLAARMEALSDPMTITASESTYELLQDDFNFVDRGDIEIKGFGKQGHYFLESENLQPEW
jgi:class 3 adenylate cyclase